MNTERKFSKNR